MNQPFDFTRLTEHARDLAAQFIGSLYRAPDFVIMPDDKEYIYRWHMVPRNREANIYFHLQMASDPERPLHDHPWDNQTVMLAGRYDEHVNFSPHQPNSTAMIFHRKVGDVIHRRARSAHRLVLPEDVPYAMTLFSTGPVVHDWGFWKEGVFTPYHEVVIEKEGKSTWR